MTAQINLMVLVWGNYSMLQDFISPVIDSNFKYNFVFVNMPHRIHKFTNTLYDYGIINY